MRNPKIDTLLKNEEEMRKCSESPLYFYNNYTKRPEDKVLSQKEFDYYCNTLLLQRNRVVRRNNNPYPLMREYEFIAPFLKIENKDNDDNTNEGN